MNIQFPSKTHDLMFFSERINGSSFTTKKKMIFVVALALGFLVACYLASRSWFTAKQEPLIQQGKKQVTDTAASLQSKPVVKPTTSRFLESYAEKLKQTSLNEQLNKSAIEIPVQHSEVEKSADLLSSADTSTSHVDKQEKAEAEPEEVKEEEASKADVSPEQCKKEWLKEIEEKGPLLEKLEREDPDGVYTILLRTQLDGLKQGIKNFEKIEQTIKQGLKETEIHMQELKKTLLGDSA